MHGVTLLAAAALATDAVLLAVQATALLVFAAFDGSSRLLLAGLFGEPCFQPSLALAASLSAAGTALVGVLLLPSCPTAFVIGH